MSSGHIIFHYDGQDRSEVPDDTTHAIVKSSLVLEQEESSTSRLFSGAFVECPNLQSVVLPEGLTVIGQTAFYSCPVLTTIHFPSSLQEIQDNAFSFCFQLTNLRLPPSLQSIGENAFFECSKISALDLSDCSELRVISDCAFQRCIRISNAFLPGGLLVIGKQAFSSCMSLQLITIPNTVKAVGEQAFVDCSCLSNIRLSQSMSIIKEGTFCGCDSLTNVIIPPNVTVIEMDAFAHCEQLERVQFEGGNLTSISDSAFVSCHSLRHLRAPPNLLEIGDYCFANCNSLVSVELPRSLEVIGDDAFSYCSSLRNIYYPSTVYSLESSVLNNCDLLEEICQEDVDRLILRERFRGLPVHEYAYMAVHEEHSPSLNLEFPQEVYESSRVDILGMTPFHILSLSDEPNESVFEHLLHHLPHSTSDLVRKDNFGSTPMELLCSHSSYEEGKAKVLFNHCIEMTIIERIRWLGLPAWRMIIFLRIDELFEEQEQRRPALGDDITRGYDGIHLASVNSLIRVYKLQRLFEELSKYELLEATSLLEMTLWKMQLQMSVSDHFRWPLLVDNISDGTKDLRLASRINCKAGIVLPNVLPFLVRMR